MIRLIKDKTFLRKFVPIYYLFVGLFLSSRAPGTVTGTIPFLLTFFVWLFDLSYIKTKSETLFKIALVLLLFVPISLIGGAYSRSIEDLTIFIFELLLLGILQEIIFFVKSKYF